MSDLDTLRQEATELVNSNPDGLVLRSCWNCNEAHSHMKSWDGSVILCPWCGHYYFKGEDITITEKGK